MPPRVTLDLAMPPVTPSSTDDVRHIRSRMALELKAAVQKIFKKIALNYPGASDWPNQDERIREWVGEALHHGLTANTLLLAYRSRQPSPYLPSANEIISLAMPKVSEEDIARSLARAIRVANTDEYHLLNDEEWWAFNIMGRWDLKHEGRPSLIKSWSSLLNEARRASKPLSSPPRPSAPVLDPALRLSSKPSDASKAKGCAACIAAMNALKKGATAPQIMEAERMLKAPPHA